MRIHRQSNHTLAMSVEKILSSNHTVAMSFGGFTVQSSLITCNKMHDNEDKDSDARVCHPQDHSVSTKNGHNMEGTAKKLHLLHSFVQ